MVVVVMMMVVVVVVEWDKSTKHGKREGCFFFSRITFPDTVVKFRWHSFLIMG